MHFLLQQQHALIAHSTLSYDGKKITSADMLS
jgi:hypothetical protein